MLALGANFSLSADSHLVAMQTPEGSYQTQAINILNKVQLHNMQTPEGSYQTQAIDILNKVQLHNMQTPEGSY